MNWLDGVIIIVLALYLIDGYRRGFLEVLIELLTFALSLIIAWWSAEAMGKFLAGFIKVQLKSFTPIGFLASWFVVQTVFSLVLRLLYKFLPKSWRESRTNKLIGIVPSLAKGVILIAIVMAIILNIPVKNQQLQKAMADSYLAKQLGAGGNRIIRTLFEDELKQVAKFVTLDPQITGIDNPQYQILDPNERRDLNFTLKNPKIDEAAETKMLILINAERTKRGIKPLAADPDMQKVARAHAADMYVLGYFSHVNLDGESPFDRMKKAGVKYQAAGENLAFAENVDVAHKGLMQSPGHKKNILEPKFGRVGIGILYGGGEYEEMFVQNFRD